MIVITSMNKTTWLELPGETRVNLLKELLSQLIELNKDEHEHCKNKQVFKRLNHKKKIEKMIFERLEWDKELN